MKFNTVFKFGPECDTLPLVVVRHGRILDCFGSTFPPIYPRQTNMHTTIITSQHPTSTITRASMTNPHHNTSSDNDDDNDGIPPQPSPYNNINRISNVSDIVIHPNVAAMVSHHPNSSSAGIDGSHSDSGGSVSTTTASSHTNTNGTTSPQPILPSFFAVESHSLLSRPPPQTSPPPQVVPTSFSDNVGIHLNDTIPTRTGLYCHVPDRISLTSALHCHSRWNNPFCHDEFASHFGHPQRRCRSLPEILDEVLEISEEVTAYLSTNTSYDEEGGGGVCTDHRVGNNDSSHPPPSASRARGSRRQRSSVSHMSQTQNRRRRSSSGSSNNDDSSQRRRANESQ